MNDGEDQMEERHQKRGFGCIIIFLLFAAVLNIVILPVSFFIGGMATDAPGSGIYEFMFGFLYVQKIPLVLLLIGILMMIDTIRKSKR